MLHSVMQTFSIVRDFVLLQKYLCDQSMWLQKYDHKHARQPHHSVSGADKAMY